MSYVVLSTDATGQPKIEDADSLDAALQLVERLRNDDLGDDVRVLREVPIEVKTYYKVVALESETSGGTGDVAPAATPAAAPPVESSPFIDAVTPPTAPQMSTAPDSGPPAEAVPSAPADDAVSVGAVPTGPAPTGQGDDGFFTPPPVRSHAIDEDVQGSDENPPSERRTSLFGRG